MGANWSAVCASENCLSGSGHVLALGGMIVRAMRYPMKFSALPVVAGLSALAAGASVLLAAPEAKAACIGGNNVCLEFNPGSVTTPTNVPLGGSVINNSFPFTKARVQFDIIGFENFPFDLTSISVNNAPGLPSSTAFNSVTNITVDSGGSFGLYNTNWVNLSSSLTTANFSAAPTTISFSIPAGVGIPNSAQLIARLQYWNAAESVGQARFSTGFTTSAAAVPGPLPILGAASAFGFSRSLRRRIKLAKSA